MHQDGHTGSSQRSDQRKASSIHLNGGLRRPIIRANVFGIMSHAVKTIEPAEDIFLAEEKMRRGHFRHLPVMDKGRLVGLISYRDILCAHDRARRSFSIAENRWFGRERVAKTIAVSDVMTTDVIVVHPEDPAPDAARLMRSHQIGCLPVVAHGQLIGVVTTADLLDLAIEILEFDSLAH